jgi:hypothetical protein
MEFSLFVARVMAIAYLAAGIGMLGGKIDLSKLVKEFSKSPGLTYVAGFVTLILGMIVINYHNIWVQDWTVLVTLIGWIAVVKGVSLIAFPQFIDAFKGVYKNTSTWGAFVLIIGIVFGYFGFLA